MNSCSKLFGDKLLGLEEELEETHQLITAFESIQQTHIKSPSVPLDNDTKTSKNATEKIAKYQGAAESKRLKNFLFLGSLQKIGSQVSLTMLVFGIKSDFS